MIVANLTNEKNNNNVITLLQFVSATTKPIQ